MKAMPRGGLMDGLAPLLPPAKKSASNGASEVTAREAAKLQLAKFGRLLLLSKGGHWKSDVGP